MSMHERTSPHRLIVAITGASGVIYGIRAMETLAQDPSVETHLILTAAARATIAQETDWKARDVEALANVVHPSSNIGASVASGSFETMGMLVAPCSIKTLSAIANSYSAELVARAADVQLKEGRPVVLLVRETPLHLLHIRNMQAVTECGAIIFPPVPAFYTRPQSLDDIVTHSVVRALDLFGLEAKSIPRWGETIKLCEKDKQKEFA